MSEYREQVIEKIARILITQNMPTLYSTLSEPSKRAILYGYTDFVKELLFDVPELAIVDRGAKDTIIGETIQETKLSRQTMKLLRDNGWVKEVKE